MTRIVIRDRKFVWLSADGQVAPVVASRRAMAHIKQADTGGRPVKEKSA